MAVTESARSSASPFRVVWRGDRWTDWQRKEVASRLRPVRGLVSGWLEAHDLEWGATPIVAHYERRYKNDDWEGGGGALNPNAYWVAVRKPHIIGDLRAATCYFAMINTHEIGHVLRWRHCVWGGLDERAASEGIASKLGDGLAKEHFGTTARMRALAEMSPEEAIRLRDDFLSDAEEPFTPEIRDKWFSGAGVRPGYLLGLWSVHERMKEGAAMPEVMQMPARQILGVE